MESSYGVRMEFITPPYAVTGEDPIAQTPVQNRPDTLHAYSTTLIVLHIITRDTTLNVILHKRS
jgi:hypothetical protein